MGSITAGHALWYTSRATGVVALLVLTTVVLLGIMVSRRGQLPGLPRFGGTILHRSLSLLAVVFIALHVLTAIADPYVTIGFAAIVLPFTSPYETFWLGLGAVALDLIIALVITSLLRARIGRRTWRAVHWLAYACWPVAVAHGLGASPDMRSGWLLGLAAGSVAAVVIALAWRIIWTATGVPPAERPALAMTEAAEPAWRASGPSPAEETQTLVLTGAGPRAGAR